MFREGYFQFWMAIECDRKFTRSYLIYMNLRHLAFTRYMSFVYGQFTQYMANSSVYLFCVTSHTYWTHIILNSSSSLWIGDEIFWIGNDIFHNEYRVIVNIEWFEKRVKLFKWKYDRVDLWEKFIEFGKWYDGCVKIFNFFKRFKI